MVNKKNILVTGANGQLGSSIKEISPKYNYIFFFKEKSELDIMNFSIVENFMKQNDIDIIINCAAYTNVNKSEIKKELADNINHLAVKNLAKLCLDYKIQLIHISTDYVFDGKQKIPYNENDKTNPINYYGLSKLKGEKSILEVNPKMSVIIRTSWLYSNKKNNFVFKVLENLKTKNIFDVVNDQVGCPTNSSDLAKFILDILPKIKKDDTEIYNYSNLGSCSRYKFALKIKEYVGGKSKINANRNSIKPLRPNYSSLNNNKAINDFNLNHLGWEESLKKFLLKHNLFYIDEI